MVSRYGCRRAPVAQVLGPDVTAALRAAQFHLEGLALGAGAAGGGTDGPWR